MTDLIFAIDPGNVDSAYVLMDAETYAPRKFAKAPNAEVRQALEDALCDFGQAVTVVIERIASYGMAVGKEVFETCEWVGRFAECAERGYGVPVKYVYRKDEKLTICGSPKANDSNIRRALIDRFATHDFKNGKGTKGNPDWFYGFSKDVWASYACGTAFLDMQKERAKQTEKPFLI